MAENKKSFILYADFIHAFENLDDDEAGRLIKHILRYVNDLNPEAPDKLTKVAFEPIKQQLKRDLVKYKGIKEFRSEIGREGGLKSGEARRKQKEANEANASNGEANEAVNVNATVNATVNVTDTVNENVKKKKEKKAFVLIYPFNSDEFKKQWEVWKQFKSEQFNFKYKGEISEQAALKELGEFSNNSEEIAIKIIHKSISKGWKGFFKLDNNGQQNSKNGKQFNRSVVESEFNKHFPPKQ